jgi:hypothetical protein
MALSRFLPRRRPRLRLVGHPGDITRHIAAFQVLDLNFVAEVWSEAEFANLADHERPAEYGILPGVGFIHFRRPNGEHELEDIKDVQKQAWAEWRMLRGLDR